MHTCWQRLPVVSKEGPVQLGTPVLQHTAHKVTLANGRRPAGAPDMLLACRCRQALEVQDVQELLPAAHASKCQQE